MAARGEHVSAQGNLFVTGGTGQVGRGLWLLSGVDLRPSGQEERKPPASQVPWRLLPTVVTSSMFKCFNQKYLLSNLDSAHL